MCGGIVDHSQTTRNKLLDLFLVSHCFYHAVRFEKHLSGISCKSKDLGFKYVHFKSTLVH